MHKKLILPILLINSLFTACLFESDDSGDQSGELSFSVGADPIDITVPGQVEGTYSINSEDEITISERYPSHCSQGQAKYSKDETTYQFEISDDKLFFLEVGAVYPECVVHQGEGSSIESGSWLIKRGGYLSPEDDKDSSSCQDDQNPLGLDLKRFKQFKNGEVSEEVIVEGYCRASIDSLILKEDVGDKSPLGNLDIAVIDCQTLEIEHGDKTLRIVIEQFYESGSKEKFVFDNGSCTLDEANKTLTDENCQLALDVLPSGVDEDMFYLSEIDTQANLDWQECMKDLGHEEFIRLRSRIN